MHSYWVSKNVFNRRNNNWKSWPDKGIVAGLIDEIGIVKLINQKLGVDNREKIPAGQVIKALILNGLGMVSRLLYLFSQFFEDKAIEKLLGTGINSEYLNDDKIGRVYGLYLSIRTDKFIYRDRIISY